MIERLAAKGASLVTATYPFGFSTSGLETGDSLTSIARVYQRVIVNLSFWDRVDLIKKLIADFQIDGIIAHSNFIVNLTVLVITI